jgi:hypothetical protein
VTVILVVQEAEIWKINVRGQHGQKAQSYFKNTQHKKGMVVS